MATTDKSSIKGLYRGIITGGISVLVTQPLDCIKTCRQVGKPLPTQFTAYYSGLRHHLMTCPVFWGVLFATTPVIQSKLDDSPEPAKWSSRLSLYIAAGLGTIASNPGHVVKTRLQVGQTDRIPLYSYFTRGTGVTLIENSKLPFLFELYFALEAQMSSWGVPASSFLAPAVAKTMLNAVTYPIDVARTTSRASQPFPTKNIYRGFLTYNMISVPRFAIAMMVARYI